MTQTPDSQETINQLRTLPAEQLVTEILSGLLNSAQVKLGRRDARLLIDLGALVLDHSRPYLPPDLCKQADHVLGQLRLGQVQAENAAQAGAEPEGEGAVPEPNDLPSVPAPPAAGAPAAPAASAPSPAPPPPAPNPPRPAASPASRLWVPGRDF